MTSASQLQPRRRALRLKGYDYSRNSAYFVTICAEQKATYFEMFSELRDILIKQWEALPDRFPNMASDAFVVMPNHLHAVIVMGSAPVGATLAVAQGVGPSHSNTVAQRAGASPAPTLGAIVGAYKSLCATDWLKYLKDHGSNHPGSFWQRNYYEHVIRTERELNLVREYIACNPSLWWLDGDNPEAVYDREYVDRWSWLENRRKTGASDTNVGATLAVAQRAGASPAPTAGED